MRLSRFVLVGITSGLPVIRPEPRIWKVSCPHCLVSELASMYQMTPTGPAYPLCRDIESRGIHGRACFRGSRRQGEVERRATPAVAVGPDPSAMPFDDRLTDCQTHAAALRFPSQERIKYLVGLAQR